MSHRKKPSAAFVVVVIVAVGPLSLGPACWLSSRVGGSRVVDFVYGPMFGTAANSAAAANVGRWYSKLGAANGWEWVADRNGHWHWIKRWGREFADLDGAKFSAHHHRLD